MLAEREGFEPPIAFRLCLISSQVHSTGLCHLSAMERPRFVRNAGPGAQHPGSKPAAPHSSPVNVHPALRLKAAEVALTGQMWMRLHSLPGSACGWQWQRRSSRSFVRDRHESLQLAAPRNPYVLRDREPALADSAVPQLLCTEASATRQYFPPGKAALRDVAE